MSVLIIAEHDNKQLNPATLHAVTAAAKLGKVDLLVAGSSASAVVESAKQVAGVEKVLVADAAHYAEGLAEELAPLVVKLAADYRYVAATATTFGKNLLPRVASLLDVPQISDLTEIVDNTTFVRPIYAGNAFETVQADSEKLVLTFRATAFDAAAAQGGHAETINVEATPAQNLSRFVNRQLSHSDRPELTQAKVIVSGGRALGSAEKFNEVLTPLADVLGAFKDKGSRFIAFAYPIRTLADVKKYLDPLKEEHHKARHWCYAYRLGVDGMQFRANDDGEPSGSAGRPILGQIDSVGVTDVLIVVVRYFGGTLLGVPGLIHAYKEATAQALAVAEVVEKNIEKTVWLRCEYPFLNEAIRIAKQHQADILEQDLQLDCRLTVSLSLANYEACVAAWKNTRQIEVNTEKPFE